MKTEKEKTSILISKGFSFVELMTALAISGLGAIFFFQFSTDNAKFQSNARKYNQIDWYTNLAGSYLAKEDACTQSLGGLAINMPNPVSTAFNFNIVTGNGREVLRHGGEYGFTANAGGGSGIEQQVNLTISIEDIQLNPDTGADSLNTFVGKVRLRYQSPGGQKSKPVDQSRYITIFGYHDGAGNFQSCRSDYQSAGTRVAQTFCEHLLIDTQMNYSEVPHAPFSSVADCLTTLRDVSGAAFTNGSGEFQWLEDLFEKRVCERMGGTYNSGSLSCSFPTVTCGSGEMFAGFENGAQGAVKCNPVGNISRGVANNNCSLASAYTWGTNPSCSGTPAVSSLAPGGSTTVTNSKNPSSQTGSLKLNCSATGNLTQSGGVCEITKCPSRVNFSFGSSCQGNIPAANEGDVVRITDSSNGSTADVRCESGGNWQVVSTTCSGDCTIEPGGRIRGEYVVAQAETQYKFTASESASASEGETVTIRGEECVDREEFGQSSGGGGTTCKQNTTGTFICIGGEFLYQFEACSGRWTHGENGIESQLKQRSDKVNLRTGESKIVWGTSIYRESDYGTNEKCSLWEGPITVRCEMGGLELTHIGQNKVRSGFRILPEGSMFPCNDGGTDYNDNCNGNNDACGNCFWDSNAKYTEKSKYTQWKADELKVNGEGCGN